ncbi:kinase-like protein [Lichtheimia hyalospora FSU 10163]|nr:kinase-like protein [Lichtheimia hyalospora FSU 10163]
MKTLNKRHMLAQRERASFMEERTVLSQANTEWIPTLHAAFQDDDNLYLVMEYAGGGDLFSVLDRKETLCLSEKEARFYIAETILAVDSLHQLGYLHRDIKPQNILIDSTGHVKLADFGSCIAMTSVTSNNSNNKEMLLPVGTCDYVSPEVLQCTSSYGTEVDWWSVGIVLYEALQQNPPFHSDKSEKDTYLNIMFHKSIEFPRPVSPACRDLIQRLLSKRETRFKRVEDIKAHPFFNGVDWDQLRNSTPPFRPTLASPDDTSNFSVLDDDTSDNDDIIWKNAIGNDHMKHLPFIGFSYQVGLFVVV